MIRPGMAEAVRHSLTERHYLR